MRVRKLLGHVSGTISSLGLAYVIVSIPMLDAPFFSFFDPHIEVGFLVCFAMAAAAAVFGSRWWLALIVLWIPFAGLAAFGLSNELLHLARQGR
jgi:hypothetical protein